MNLKELAQNLGLEDNEFLEIVTLFVETSCADFKKMQTAFQEDNAKIVFEAAHSIKGAAGNFGFMKAFEAAGKIEFDAQQGQISAAAETVQRLKNELDHIKNLVMQ